MYTDNYFYSRISYIFKHVKENKNCSKKIIILKDHILKYLTVTRNKSYNIIVYITK